MEDIYCIDNPIVFLIGNHSPEGSFDGPGIIDNNNGTANFDPQIAGIGDGFNISYQYINEHSCLNTHIQTVSVKEIPEVMIVGLESNYCENSIPDTIFGYPVPDENSTGYFTGEGITEIAPGIAIFSSQELQVGNFYDISYSYSDEYTCLSSFNIQVNIIQLPDSPVVENINVCLNSDIPEFQAIGNTGFNFYWYDINNQLISQVPNYQSLETDPGVYYYYVEQEDPISLCVSERTEAILTIYDELQIVIPQFPATCIYDYNLYLTGEQPSGGIYSGAGIIQLDNGDWVFNPEIAGVGTHDIIYEYSNENGCNGTASTQIIVNGRPEVDIIDLDTSYCRNTNPITINGNQIGSGTFWGIGIIDNNNGSAIFSPSIVNENQTTVYYEIIDPNTTCSNIDTNEVSINHIPGNIISIIASAEQLCENNTQDITLEAIGGNGDYVQWHLNECDGIIPNIINANVDSSMIIIDAPIESLQIFAKWVNSCGSSSDCASKHIIVTPTPSSPDTAYASNNNYCIGTEGEVELIVQGGNYGETLV